LGFEHHHIHARHNAVPSLTVILHDNPIGIDQGPGQEVKALVSWLMACL
jgi:hypothetical protein